jgi:hypothetical protein
MGAVVLSWLFGNAEAAVGILDHCGVISPAGLFHYRRITVDGDARPKAALNSRTII